MTIHRPGGPERQGKIWLWQQNRRRRMGLALESAVEEINILHRSLLEARFRPRYELPNHPLRTQ
jgi:hypothetical protein